MALFPLTISSSMPAFPSDQETLKVYFTFPGSYETVYRSQIGCAISYQLTNKTALAGGANILSLGSPQTDDKGYFVTIQRNQLDGGWKTGTLYKLQLRYTQRGETSEWSTVCYMKATANYNDIDVEILNSIEGNVMFYQSPLFKGKYDNPNDSSETEARYKFDLYDFQGNLLETTGWSARLSGTPHDEVVFNYAFEDLENYRVIYTVETKNGFIKSAEYSFNCTFSIVDNPNLSISCELNEEEGCVKLTISSTEMIADNLVVRRTDSKSDFKKWEDYKIFNVLDEKASITFYDYLVESGIEYKYGVQKIDAQGYRGDLILSDSIYVTYEHMYLVGNNRQLKLKFNPAISSYKRQLQESKVETLGSKYPFITRNGAVSYFTFPIAGLISFMADEEEHFIKKAEMLKANDLITAPSYGYANIDDDNIVTEREYRREVEEFLTNGDYKFFKSPTEGVKIVSITDVSLAPITTVSRMLHNLSCTANEIAEATLTQALECGIVDSGSYLDVGEMGTRPIDGTINLTVSQQNQDLYALIAATAQSVPAELGYTKQLQYLSYLKIEITNPYAVTNKTYRIQIKDSPDGAYRNFVIPTDVGSTAIYELDNVIKIYGLRASDIGIGMVITFTGECSYQGKPQTISVNNLQSVQKFYQLYENFTDALKNKDIFSQITNEENENGERLKEILNLSYLRIQAQAGTQIKINGDLFTVGASEDLEFRGVKIMSAQVVSDVLASITVIYNGIKYSTT